MRVAILFDSITPEDVIADKDVLQQVGIVIESLTRLGHTYYLHSCTLDLCELKAFIQTTKPDVCFNLLDTLDSQDCLAHLPIMLLDAMRVRHTGPTGNSIALATNKMLAKDRMSRAGIVTPRWISEDNDVALNSHEIGRYIIKGASEDGSFAMSDASVVGGTVSEIKAMLRLKLESTGRHHFAEEYIDGREFTVPFLCGETLPVVEITYKNYPDGKPKILAQSAKWKPDSFEYKNNGVRYDITDSMLVGLLESITERCMSLFDLYGWGRIDFRVAGTGRLDARDASVAYVIDVNANSCLAPDAWFAGSLKHSKIPFDSAIQKILEDAR